MIRQISSRIKQAKARAKDSMAMKSTGCGNFAKVESKVKLLFVILCFWGCIYQIVLVTQMYFKFETVSISNIKRPDFDKAPDLTLCFNYGELLSPAFFGVYPGLGLSREGLTEEAMGILTIGEVFNFTPIGGDLMESCMYRYPNSYRFEAHTDGYLSQHEIKLKCNQIFSVKKFYRQRYMCYAFSAWVGSNESYRYSHVIGSWNSPGTLYIIALNRLLLHRVTYINVYLHSKDSYPRITSDYLTMVTRVFDNRNHKEINNYFSLTYSKLKRVLRPYPFDTNCIDYNTIGFESSGECIDQCILTKSLRQFNKIPFTVVVKEPHPLKVIYRDIENTSFADELTSTEESCYAYCFRSDCEKEYFVPKVLFKGKDRDNVVFRVYASNEPVIVSTFTPRLTFPEYFAYLISFIGFWLGLSVLQVALKATAWLRCPEGAFAPLRARKPSKAVKRR